MAQSIRNSYVCACTYIHFIYTHTYTYIYVSNAFAKPSICGLVECLIHHHGIPYNMASDNQKTTSVGSCSWNSLVLPFILKQLT
jgi:hypothetical protein